MASLIQPIKKEARMKKIIIVLLALFLALPVLSHAGSVTSKWDMTIGGLVTFGMGYSDQSNSLGASAGSTSAGGENQFLAARSGYKGNQNRDNEYGNFFSTGADARLNFLVKGPDGWGAKTSAFIEGEFRGASIGGVAEGGFYLRHAFMKLAWPNATLTVGHTWQRWGFMPSFAAVGQIYGYNDIGPFTKGLRQPRIDFEQRFGKNLSASIALVSPNVTLGGLGVTPVDSFSMSKYPFLEGEFKYATDKCGVIGPYGLMAALGGFYGQEKKVIQYNTIVTSGLATTGQNSNLYTDRDVNAWAIALKAFIPIIPEKNKNKKGALSLSGNLFYGQNLGWFAGPLATSMTQSYQRVNSGVTVNTSGAGSATYVAPSIVGGFGQVTYFITDKLFVDGYYGYLKSNKSDYQKYYADPTGISSTTQLIFNVNYDINQAIRIGAQYMYVRTVYDQFQYQTNAGVASSPYSAGNPVPIAGNSASQVLARDGSANIFRIGAYYFF